MKNTVTIKPNPSRQQRDKKILEVSFTNSDFESAFNYCREKNKPVMVKIDGQRWRLYPSGKATLITPPGARRKR